MSQQTTLRVLLNIDPEAVEYRYVLRDDIEGTVLAEGSSDISALPIATSLVLVIPFSSTTITKIRLPSGIKFQSTKFEQMLPAAVEDQILSDMTQVHVVAAPVGDDGFYPVVVVDKSWLKQQVDGFLRLEKPLTAIVPEVLFGALEPTVWELSIVGDDSLLRMETMSAMMVDSAHSGPPIGLVLRLGQTAEELRPETLRVVMSQPDIDLTSWSEDLGLSVEVLPLGDKARWMVEDQLPAINLMTREFLPKRKGPLFLGRVSVCLWFWLWR